MDLPPPTGITGRPGPGAGLAPQTADGRLAASADVDPSPFVSSIPSSPYLGSTSPGLGSVPRFGDTEAYEAVVARLEALNLPEPEGLSADSRWRDEERQRLNVEMQEILDNMNLPDPEYVTRAAMRAEGIKTPDPTCVPRSSCLLPRSTPAAELVRPG